MPRRPVPLLLASATAAAVAVSLTGCVGGGADTPSPKPTASKSALFSSDKEALKAAEKAYQAYLDVANELGQGGWKDTRRLKDVAAGDVLKGDTSEAEDFASKGLRQTGARKFDSMTIQQAGTSLATYVCLDVTDTDVVDSSGTSIVKPGRMVRLPLVVTFSGPGRHLKLEQSKTWSGSDVC